MNFNEKLVVIILGILLIALFGIWWYQQDAPSDQAEVHQIIVQIEGAVLNPGVYKVAEGTRLFELIELAGGAQQGAYLQNLNLAAPLYDGQKVIVAFALQEEKENAKNLPLTPALDHPETSLKDVKGNLVNINLAAAAELETLPGIGPVIAQRIVEYREQHGPFHSLDELAQVKGIGPKKLEKLQDLVCF
ncbi:ComEA family DNA-binding protein [Thermatribacter velox]|jgi:competence protein ComEA|uniref:ComEA family DNA-binding protein n=1 Tax=Thermatribacter velox TaxID=3039681 RepID=A0ABZ2Y912_9BACT